MMSNSKILLEVERKFCGFTSPHLKQTIGSTSFRTLQFLGRHEFRDTYYDRDDKLSRHGIWIRKRQLIGQAPRWEAKCRKGGSFTNSMFEELTSVEAITRCLHGVTGGESTSCNDFGLDVTAELVTDRKMWCADDEFKIVLDSMNFGHTVGEVELEMLLSPPDDTIDIEHWKRRTMEGMDLRIDDFMRRYQAFFRPGAPEGKLTAYFKKYQRRTVS